MRCTSVIETHEANHEANIGEPAVPLARQRRIVRMVTGAAIGFSLLSMVALAGETLLAGLARAGLLIHPAHGVLRMLGTVHALYFTSLLFGLCLGLCTCRTRAGRLAIGLALFALSPAISYFLPAGHN